MINPDLYQRVKVIVFFFFFPEQVVALWRPANGTNAHCVTTFLHL